MKIQIQTCLFAFLIPLAAWAQSTPSTAAAGFIPQPILPGGVVLPLFPPNSPHLKQDRIHEAERYNTTIGGTGPVKSVINIHNPSIEVHLTNGDVANTGTAVIVVPGGGHQILWVGPEGGDFVPFFKGFGVSTIILRNRLRVDGYDAKVEAVDDAFQAIRLVRAHAAEWKIDPARIGIVGFSAGAELASATALFFSDFEKKNDEIGDPLAKVSARPDFVGLVYPGPTPFYKAAGTSIPPTVPPTFITCAGSGDKVHAIWATEYFTAMLQAGVPNLEMHIYGNGEHGGGLSRRKGIPFGTWTDRYIDWFRDLGFLSTSGLPTKAAGDVAAYARKKS